MRIYMDVCCYNRPLDDQTQDRIRFETEAILQIIRRCARGEWKLIGSNVVDFELSKYNDIVKQQEAYKFYHYSETVYNMKNYPDAQNRAKQYQTVGVGATDSLHLAIAESADVNILLSTDDQFVNSAKRTNAKVPVKNPIQWLLEVSDNES